MAIDWADAALGAGVGLLGAAGSWYWNKRRYDQTQRTANKANQIANEANNIAEQALGLAKRQAEASQKANVEVIHWNSGSGEGERGLVVQNLGPGAAKEVMGEVARPMSVEAWTRPALSPGDQVGLIKDTARSIEPCLGPPEPGEVPHGQLKARVGWTNLDGTKQQTDWLLIKRI